MELKEHERRHLEKMYPYMGEFVVLLKKNGDFPLKEAGEIALYGNGGRFTIKGGTGSGEVNSRFFINCEEGLKERGFTVKTASWLDGYDEAREKDDVVYIILNTLWKGQQVRLPSLPEGHAWGMCINTADPDGKYYYDEPVYMQVTSFMMTERSICVFTMI